MNKPPFGSRRPEDEELFKNPSIDASIVPDRVSPPLEGYFRIPAIWVGEEHSAGLVGGLNPPIHHHVVIEK